MKELTKEEKGSLIFNYGMNLTINKGFNCNDELIKQTIILEACVKTEKPVPKQLEPLNERKELLRNTENIFPVYDARTETSLGTHDASPEARELCDLSEMMLNEIDKYIIDSPDEELQIFKSNMKYLLIISLSNIINNMSMFKSKPEFKRMPQVQQYYDIDDTFGVASRKKYLEDMKLRIEEAENRVNILS